MGFLLTGQFWWYVAVAIAAVILLAKVSVNQRPALSYLINPPFWFSGAVDQTKSRSYYYSYNRQQIRYSPYGNWFELGNSLIEAADLASFEVLDEEYARDRKHIYYGSEIISDQIDHESFAIIDPFLVRDKHHLYVNERGLIKSDLNYGEFMQVEHADPDSFEQLGDSWAKDRNHYYYDFRIMDVDYDSFEILTPNVVKDKHAVFIDHQERFIKTELVGENVRALNDKYLHDKHHIYWYAYDYIGEDDKRYNGELITNIWLESVPYHDLSSFNVISDEHFAVDNRVFKGAKQIVGADAATFRLIDHEHFAKDAQQVFYETDIIAQAKPANFKLLTVLRAGIELPSQYGQDSERLYFQAKNIAPLGTQATVMSNEDYLKTERQVFFLGKPLKGVNVAQFTLLEKFANFGSDGKHIYAGHERIEGIDLDSAEVVIRESVIRDATSVFWHSKKIQGADPDSFTRSHANYQRYDMEDANYYYWRGARVESKE